VQPSVQLEESCFDLVSVETSPEHTPESGGRPTQPAIEVTVNLATVDDRPGVCNSTLDSGGKGDDCEPPPYRLSLRTVDFYRHSDDEGPEAEVARVVGVNGCSVLC